jgi:hypothetical protein
MSLMAEISNALAFQERVKRMQQQGPALYHTVKQLIRTMETPAASYERPIDAARRLLSAIDSGSPPASPIDPFESAQSDNPERVRAFHKDPTAFVSGDEK